MKILIVGEVNPGGSLMLIYQNLLKQGVNAEFVDTRKYFIVSFINRVINKFLPTPWYFGSGIKKMNEAVLLRVRSAHFDFIIFNKPIFIYPETILELKKSAKVFSWYPDHVDFTKSGSTYFYKSIPLFDCHFAAIAANVPALLRWGAQKALYVHISADPSCHHPVPVTDEDRKKLGADVVFIGTHAKEKRAEYLEQLCRDGYDVKIYGNGWHKLPKNSCLRSKDKIRSGGVYCDDMARVIGSSKISLNFMREHNHETLACRSWEIPLCGGFMLHESTDEARQVFRAGEDADFFSSYEEMKNKIDYYLQHQELRERIAKAGYERAIKSGKLLDGTVRQLIDILVNDFGGTRP